MLRQIGKDMPPFSRLIALQLVDALDWILREDGSPPSKSVSNLRLLEDTLTPSNKRVQADPLPAVDDGDNSNSAGG